MAIYTYLDASTGHITKKDNDLLQLASTSENIPGCYVYPYDCGYFIAVYPDVPTEEEKNESGLSENFFMVVNHARKNGCLLLRLDVDGNELEGFDLIDW